MKQQLENLLRSAFELGASDIHLTVGVPPVMRINGELKKHGATTLKPEDTENMAKAIIPDSMWEKFKKQGELDFSYGIPGVSRFRVNAYHQRSCVGLAVRVIPRDIPTFEELRLPAVFRDFALLPQGLVLVTGPTGSGKSTTLAAMIDEMNRTVKNILSRWKIRSNICINTGHALLIKERSALIPDLLPTHCELVSAKIPM